MMKMKKTEPVVRRCNIWIFSILPICNKLYSKSFLHHFFFVAYLNKHSFVHGYKNMTLWSVKILFYFHCEWRDSTKRLYIFKIKFLLGKTCKNTITKKKRLINKIWLQYSIHTILYVYKKIYSQNKIYIYEKIYQKDLNFFVKQNMYSI